MQPSTSTTDTNHEQTESPDLTVVQAKFYNSDRYHIARKMLEDIVASGDHKTHSNYHHTGDLDFCERHLDYLSRHPNLQLAGYMSNLKLMTRTRSK